MVITHRFTSPKADSADATIINPSNWNATHSFSNMPYLDSSDYNFTAQLPGGSLTAGITNSITLVPVPKGVNGTNTQYYIRLQGGSGTPEDVLVTGGTATSEATTGTLTFIPVNNHSGAWSILSSSAGIGEALAAVVQGGTVWVPPNASGYNITGPFALPAYVSLIGQPIYGSQRGQFAIAPGPTFGEVFGTCLSLTWGAGSSSGTQILMRSGCTVAGFSFFYPNQVNTATPVIYPPTIKLDPLVTDPDHCKIYDVFSPNTYNFIDATTNHSKLHVKGVYGCAINVGINIDGATDADIIENILLKGLFHDSAIYSAYASNKLSGYIIANGIAVKVGLADGIRISTVYTFGYRIGLYLAKSGARGSYGSINSFQTDSCRFGLYQDVDGISNMMMCSDCAFSGNDGVSGLQNSYGIWADTNGVKGILMLSSSSVSSNATSGQNALFSRGLKIQLVNGWISTWGSAAAAIQLEGASTLVLDSVYIDGYGVSSTIFITFNNFTGIPPRLIGVNNVQAFLNSTAAGSTPLIDYIGCVDINGPYNYIQDLHLFSGTANATGGAATLNKQVCLITSEALVTAIGAIYTLTLTNSKVAATSTVLPSVYLGTATTGTPQIVDVKPAGGSVVIRVKNIDGANAFNGTIKVTLVVIN